MEGHVLTLTLRLIHILVGIFWVGTVFFIAGFLVPTVRATGREGGAFVQHLMQKRRLQIFLIVAMLLTVLSGIMMYARQASATHGAWAGTAPGIAYGVGAVAAILGGVVGAAIGGAAGRRLATLGSTIGAGGPSPEQQREMGRLQARMGLGTSLAAGFLAIAAGAMAIARYL